MSAHELARRLGREAGLLPPEPARATGTGHAAPVRHTGDVSAYAGAAFRAEVERVETAAEGTRNAALNTAAFALGQLVAAGELGRDLVADTLTSVALAVGLERGETAATIASGLGAGMRQPRAVPAPLPAREALGGVIVPNGQDRALDGRTGAAALPAALADPALIFGARPELAVIWEAARARRVGPWAVLGSCLVRVVGATLPSAMLPAIVGGRASLNLFLAVVGFSGIGKGASEACARDVIWMTDSAEPHVAIPGSGEGLAHAYAHRVGKAVEMLRTNVIFSVSEIDTLAATGSRQGSTLLPLLRAAWSGEGLGFTTADATRRLPIAPHTYRACLSVGVQPGRAGSILDDHAGGTPQRFVWLPAVDPDAPDEVGPMPSAITWRPPMVAEGINSTFKVCDRATADVIADRTARLRSGTASLDGHAMLARLKLAAAFALLDVNRADRLTITDHDWQLATLLHAVSDYTRGTITEHLSAEVRASAAARSDADASRAVMVDRSVDEDRAARIARRLGVVVRTAGADGIPWNEARTAVAHRDRDLFPDAVERLQRAGRIRVTGTHGDQAHRLFAIPD